MSAIHELVLQGLDGSELPLAPFEGQVLLLVNVASQCGLTPQYAGLEQLQQTYQARGFSVLGLPCNQFAGQEPGSEAEIASFCSTKFDVTFPLFAKIEVNGAGRHPLYRFLTAQATQPDGPGDIKWNFAKFVIDKQGVVRYSEQTSTPKDLPNFAAIKTVLAQLQ